ncbi:MAG: hypothetical protein [Phormidium phage MIS-PhV1A]|uniref:hypothetical protein n=1 Tax=Phormidium phage MIS-PhV1A TaxID=1391455 RepID=UPI0003C9E9D4|nr:MAG: hypothetical protein AV945_gp23 [Phormidium phage MIS-PhV1A]AGZ61768.1 MAG: hypothetical protein [Phormidium phage MIS-PhV1A]
MGGRGKEGQWPTIKVYAWDTFFFNGIEESLFNVNAGYGKPSAALYTVDEWGTQHYYMEAGEIECSGVGINMKCSVKKFIAVVGFSINLVEQAMGRYYRIDNVRLVGKAQVWANRTYPAWALKL